MESKISFVSEKNFHKGVYVVYISTPDESDIRIFNIRTKADGGEIEEAHVEITKTQQKSLLECLNKPISKKEIARKMGHRSVSGSLKKAIAFLLDKKLINYTIPDKPQSSKQRYVITEKGREVLEAVKNEK